MSRVVGFTRQLLPREDLAADADELRAAGAVDVFTDEWGADAATPGGLQACLAALEPGDTLLVTSAARLAPAAQQFVTTVNALTARGVAFRALADPALSAGVGEAVDPGEVLAALAALKRRLASLQTRAGMTAAATAGRRAGRPTVMTPERIAMAVELRNLGRPYTHIARVLGVSPNAVQRALAATDA